MSDERVKHGPFTTAIVRGDPIHVDGHELVPWVRVTSRVRRRAYVGAEGVGGGGWGFVHMRPVAVADRSGAGEQRLQFGNEAAGSLVWLSLVFLAVPLVAFLLVHLLRGSDDKTL